MNLTNKSRSEIVPLSPLDSLFVSLEELEKRMDTGHAAVR